MVLLSALLILLLLSALWAITTVPLIRSAIALSLTSVILSIIMFQLGAPYAAVFELSVCAGLIPVIFISVISLAHRLPFDEHLRRRKSRLSRFWPLPFILVAAAIFLYWIKPASEIFVTKPEAINDVRILLWNYRRFDLFGQIIALLAGAFGVLILFKNTGDKK
ncbi:MAG: NADH-quinone oxidoreductase subunit J [Candidatus Margulisiibacteriota bacterium]